MQGGLLRVRSPKRRLLEDIKKNTLRQMSIQFLDLNTTVKNL